jgi:hypothetical protein
VRLLDSDEAWTGLFQQAERSAFHLEVKDAYAVPEESEPLRRFLNEEPADDVWFEPWADLMEQLTGRGVAVSRIRVVTVPHTDYQRWCLALAALNTQAGEDIRYLPRHLAQPDITPPDDWWMFDNERVAFNLTGEDGKPGGLAVTTDPGIAAYCWTVRKHLWELAIPYAEYVDSHYTRQ